MSYLDDIPRMEKWLTIRGLPAKEILLCTQYVHTGDPAYILTEEDAKKDQATKDMT